jgi:hexosaminidase
MKKYRQFLLLSIIMIAAYACSHSSIQVNNSDEINIIPVPAKMEVNTGYFTIKTHTAIFYNDTALKHVANYLGSGLNKDLSANKILEGQGKGINLVISDIVDDDLGEEGYKLIVSSKKIDIIANKANGVFYGIQTLLQMIPLQAIGNSEKVGVEGKIKCVEITDSPRFEWRGLMLDVSRHFFTVDEVKSMIDQMAMYKFNILQLHLTDDQGWRIEIKKLPLLTEVGAWRVPRTGLWWERELPNDGEDASYGGFYTQEEIRNLVHYASERFVNILPEIEAPGHSLAAIASYPYLSSTGLKYKVNPGSRFYKIDDNSLCAGKESTYEFMDQVLSEVADLFPFEYIHIGGDECYKGFWKKCPDCQKRMKEIGLKNEKELQSYFIRRLEKILEAKDKKLIGWDEILEGGLAPNAAVMSWRGMEGGITAAKAKHNVVMSPVDYAYLDFYQGDPAIEPPTYAMLRLKKVYEFEPVPDSIDPEYILGGQGNLWTESVPTYRHAEYMLWPRALALSEVLWSPLESREWNDFINRTETHLRRMDQSDINYAVSFYDAIITPSKDEKGNMVIELGSELDGVDIYYTFDNTYPDNYSALYSPEEKLTIPRDADTFKAITYREGKPIGRIITIPLTDLEKRVPK